MPEYRVNVQATLVRVESYYVEADTPEEAEQKALKAAREGEILFDFSIGDHNPEVPSYEVESAEEE